MRWKLPPIAAAAHFIYAAKNFSSFEPDRFSTLFGVTAETAALSWNLCKDECVVGMQAKHMLWALLLVKTHAK